MTTHDDGETGGDQSQQQLTQERLSMDASEIEDAIDQEQDQVSDGNDASRYQSELEDSPSDERA